MWASPSHLVCPKYALKWNVYFLPQNKRGRGGEQIPRFPPPLRPRPPSALGTSILHGHCWIIISLNLNVRQNVPARFKLRQN